MDEDLQPAADILCALLSTTVRGDRSVDICWKCPICLEIPSGEIFQCKNGHSLCSSCCSRSPTCPTCRLNFDFAKIRNRALEEQLDTFNFDCPHKDKGCQMRLTRGLLATHPDSCNFS